MTVVIGPSAAARYWRINITAQYDARGYCTIGEIYFYDVNGIDITTGGTPFASDIYNAGYPATKAFDKNTSTFWTTTSAASHNIGYDFGSDVDVSSIKIVYPYGYNTLTEAPKDYTIDYSDDGVNWNTAVTITDGPGWSYGEARTVELIPAKTLSGTAKLYNGMQASKVYAFDWSSGVLIGSAVPNVDGSFEMYVSALTCGITVIGPQGYRPVSDGPIDLSSS